MWVQQRLKRLCRRLNLVKERWCFITSILVISDLHCGHAVGLTPPPWQVRPLGDLKKLHLVQKKQWDIFSRDACVAPDVLFVNGDMIDGTNSKSGGTEQITTDRTVQAEMAIQAIKTIGARKIFMTYGTPYHTGEAEDFEKIVATGVKAESIGSREMVRVSGVLFDLRHFISGSGVPHTRSSASARERLWSQQWGIEEGHPTGDVIIRSHVHYHSFCGGPGWLAMTTPALQGYGSRYGSRKCSGIVHYGWITFDISAKGVYSWQAHIQHIQEQFPKVSQV